MTPLLAWTHEKDGRSYRVLGSTFSSHMKGSDQWFNKLAVEADGKTVLSVEIGTPNHHVFGFKTMMVRVDRKQLEKDSVYTHDGMFQVTRHTRPNKPTIGTKEAERLKLHSNMVKVPPWQRPSSPPVPPQRVPGGSRQLATPRGEAQPLGGPPPPRGLKRTASKGRSPFSPPSTIQVTLCGVDLKGQDAVGFFHGTPPKGGGGGESPPVPGRRASSPVRKKKKAQ